MMLESTQRSEINRRNIPVLVALLVLVCATLACVINVGGPRPPQAPIPVSTEAVQSLNDFWQIALEAAKESGEFLLVINESQITSLLAFRLQSQTEPIFHHPQVYLREGQIQIYGTAIRGMLEANARMVLSVAVDDEGLPQLALTSADFGPLPVPEGLLSGLSAALDEAFTGNLGPAATGIRIENIAIQDGLLALSGRVR